MHVTSIKFVGKFSSAQLDVMPNAMCVHAQSGEVHTYIIDRANKSAQLAKYSASMVYKAVCVAIVNILRVSLWLKVLQMRDYRDDPRIRLLSALVLLLSASIATS